MAQDPERDDEERDRDQLLTSHALDMVALWDSSAVDAEVEADMIRGVLDSAGVEDQDKFGVRRARSRSKYGTKRRK